MVSATALKPTPRWSVDSFAAFWQRPDASRVSAVVTEDIVGHWPRPIGVVQGARPYVAVIAALLEVCPDFTARVAETAASADFTFIRWVAKGTGPDGAFELTGCDRVRTRDGHVCENYVFADHPLFAHIAAALTRSR